MGGRRLKKMSVANSAACIRARGDSRSLSLTLWAWLATGPRMYNLLFGLSLSGPLSTSTSSFFSNSLKFFFCLRKKFLKVCKLYLDINFLVLLIVLILIWIAGAIGMAKGSCGHQ